MSACSIASIPQMANLHSCFKLLACCSEPKMSGREAERCLPYKRRDGGGADQLLSDLSLGAMLQAMRLNVLFLVQRVTFQHGFSTCCSAGGSQLQGFPVSRQHFDSCVTVSHRSIWPSQLRPSTTGSVVTTKSLVPGLSSAVRCVLWVSHWLSVRIQPLLLRSLLQCDNPVCGFIDTLNPLYVSPQSVTLYGSSMLGGSVPAGQPLEIEGASQPGLVTKNGLVLYGTDGKPVRFAGVILK